MTAAAPPAPAPAPAAALTGGGEPPRVAIIGLGYVGLPLALEMGRRFETMGFDIDARRIEELDAGHDRTRETTAADLAAAEHLRYTTDPAGLAGCNTYIVTVPTPIDAHKQPDLTPLLKASETVGRVLSKGDVVVYESTVYPGATEEVCVPILERVSGLTFNRDFFAGYSPERINPGDKQHRLTTIVKVTSGSTPEAADYVDALYGAIITAGTHKAPSIRVAEAAKVIENTQRDLNIALVNELALIFARLDLDTTEVLAAAGTKWNFLPFRPGLVGGHCIGVDPYYLTFKAQAIGYHPEVILAGRRINDTMSAVVAGRLVRDLIRRDIRVKGARALVLGLTFKADCPDLRNTKVIDLVRELESYGVAVDVADSWADPAEAEAEFGRALVAEPEAGAYDLVVCAVGHRDYVERGAASLRAYGRENSVLFDLNAVFDKSLTDGRL